ncbi:uncharacterized protein YueI [Pedobacter sp. UYEF25]
MSNLKKANKDSVGLKELSYFDNGANQSRKNPALSLAWKGSAFYGIWVNGDGSQMYPIKLEEKYPEGSFKFDIEYYSDSTYAISENPTARTAKFSIIYLKPKTDSEHGKWLDEQLRLLEGITEEKMSRKTQFEKLARAYFQNYRKSIKNFLDKASPAYLNFSNQFHHQTGYIAFNDRNYVNVEVFSENQIRGDVRNSSMVYCFDVKNKKRLALTDVVDMDNEKLQNILKKIYKDQYNYEPRNSYEETAFNQSLFQTDNFYFNQYGLAVLSNPGGMPGNVKGQVLIFVPLKDVEEYSKPEFKTRIEI